MRKHLKVSLYLLLPVVLVLLVTVLIPYLAFILRSTDISRINKKAILVIAHRGASGYVPENTLASFRKAINMGADILELDVHLTSDDSLVVMHDYNVSRTTDGQGDIESFSFQRIRQLDAGSWYSPTYRHEKVPTLAEVLQLVKGRKKVLVELKWPAKGLYNSLVERVVRIIRQHHAESWVILQSFETRYLEQASRLAPDLKIQQLLLAKPAFVPAYFDIGLKFGQFMPQLTASSVNIFYLYLTPQFIKQMHDAKKTVYAFTPNTEETILRVINLQVNGIITNYPDKALKALGR